MFGEDFKHKDGFGSQSEGSVQCADIPELEFSELIFVSRLGRGTYGMVNKMLFRNKEVAVKIIETAMEKRALSSEARQLQRLKHENIVKLFGGCYKPCQTIGKSAKVNGCLVMEYMDGGSLQELLRGHKKIAYTCGHGIRWMTQCANAIAYLHDMRLVHRDLKPANLLLTDHWRLLKVCDFGTVADLKSTMTNNRGSAAYMAPEVFEGSKYGNKCDVFSLGIILWQVLARRRPYEDFGTGLAYRIMWMVHEGTRPYPIAHLPPLFARVMQSCWQKDAALRPSMRNVYEIMELLTNLFPGGDVPLRSDSLDSSNNTNRINNDATLKTSTTGEQLNEPSTPSEIPIISCCDVSTILSDEEGTPVSIRLPPKQSTPTRVTESPLESLSGSLHNLQQVDNESAGTSSTFVPGHSRRRGGSYETALLCPSNSNNNNNNNNNNIDNSSQMTTNYDFQRTNSVKTRPPRPPPPIPPRPKRSLESRPPPSCSMNFNQNDQCPYDLIEPHLRPLPPIDDNEESYRIYEEHINLADAYLDSLKRKDQFSQQKYRKELQDFKAALQLR